MQLERSYISNTHQNIVAYNECDWHYARLTILKRNNAKKPAHRKCWLKKQRKLNGSFEFGKILRIARALQWQIGYGQGSQIEFRIIEIDWFQTALTSHLKFNKSMHNYQSLGSIFIMISTTRIE